MYDFYHYFHPYQSLMPAALAFLILIAFTNYVMIFFSCNALHVYGAWLNKYHRVDLWLLRVLVSKAAGLAMTILSAS